MPTIYERSSGKFFTKEAVAKPMLLTISGWHEDNVGNPPEPRDILDFEETDKGLVLNNTKKRQVAAALGIFEMNEWAGHKIVLEQDPTILMGNKVVGGIKCRAPRGPATPAPAPAIPRSISQRMPAAMPAAPAPADEPPGELPPEAVEDEDVPF